MDTATRMEPPKDKRALEKLVRIAGLTAARRKQPCLVDSEGREIPLPEQLFGLIVMVARDLQAGRSVFVVSGEQAICVSLHPAPGSVRKNSTDPPACKPIFR